MSKIKSKDFGGRESDFVIVLQKRACVCHSELEEDSEVCEWFMCNEFRFFTSLRCVQNDRGKGRCVRDDRGKGRCVRDDREGAVRPG